MTGMATTAMGIQKMRWLALPAAGVVLSRVSVPTKPHIL